MAYHPKEKDFPEDFYATHRINQKEQSVSMIWGEADNWVLVQKKEKVLQEKMMEIP